MRKWWKRNKYDVVGWIIVGAIILAVFGAAGACLRWIVIQPLWSFQFDKWLKTATIGEVVLLFGSLFVLARLLSNPSLTVKKDD